MSRNKWRRMSWPEYFVEGAFSNGGRWLTPKFVGEADLSEHLPQLDPMDSVCLRTAST